MTSRAATSVAQRAAWPAWAAPATVASICLVMLALFALVELLGVPVLSDDSPDLGGASAAAAAGSFALLVADVVLPVPASGVMVANGALFGVVGGVALSLAGSQVAALAGYALGRAGGARVERLIAGRERAHVAATLQRRGMVAIVLTRPLPILAETATILAGAARLPLPSVAAATAIGSLPPAVVYALAGNAAARSGQSALVFVGVVAAAGLLWLTQRR